MRSLFLRLYLMLIVAFVCIGWGIDQLYNNYAQSADTVSDLDLHKGTLLLINRELSRLPEEMQDAHLSALEQSFGYSMQLVESQNLSSHLTEQNIILEQAQMAFLQSGGPVSAFNNDSNQGWFMQTLTDRSKIILMGPIRHYRDAQNTQLYTVLLFLCLAAVVFLWVWPLSKSLLVLTKTAAKFGSGEFDARVPLNIYKPLQGLATNFNDMAERIQRLIESNKELSHGVSHELRAPISRIRFAAEMAQTSPKSDKRELYFETIDNNIEELDSLVEELLLYARFDREQPELNFVDVDLVSFCRTIVNTMSITEPKLNINFVEYKKAQLFSCIDQSALNRVLDNLLRNACRYAKEKIEIKLTETQNAICIEVSDDGPGVPENQRERLFEPFFRLDKSRDKKSGGLGLGLAMSKRLIALHQGKIDIAESQLGGACFRIELAKTKKKKGT